MSGVVITVIVLIVVLALVVGGWAVMRQRRRRALQSTFGNEYPRAVEESGNRRTAEKELLDRKQRHDQLDIRPLSPERREQYTAQWAEVQVRFVDAPTRAVRDADELVERVIEERGYPVGDFDRRTADLSVEHADVLDHYRAGHEIGQLSANNAATTEQLREAMVHYRRLFESLLSGAREPEPHESR